MDPIQQAKIPYPHAEEQLQEQQDRLESSFTSLPYIDKEKPDLIKWQLDSGDLVEEFEHYLKGETYDLELGKWIEKEERKIMNDKGVNAIIPMLRMRLSKIVIMSDLDKEDIHIIAGEFIDGLIPFFAKKHKEFELEKSFMSYLLELIDDIVFITLKRAEEGGERNFLKTTERRVESFVTNPNQQNQKNGMFGGLFKI